MTVDVELEEVDGSVALTVSDDGPGIAEQDRVRVFERFAQVDDARGRVGGGAGLGLAIVLEIVATHGGAVQLVHAEVGARFVVTLPASGS